MPTDDQLIQFPFGDGLDEFFNTKALEPPALSRADNVQCSQQGQIRKRYGFSAESTSAWPTGSVSDISRLVPVRDTWGVVASGTLYAHVETVDKLKSLGPLPMAVVERRPRGAITTTSATAPRTFDSIEVNGYIVAAWIGADDIVYAEIHEAATGISIRNAEAIGTGPDVRLALAKIGSVVFVAWGSFGATRSLFSKIDLTSETTITTGWSAQANLGPNTLQTSGYSANCYDAVSGTTFWYLIQEDSSVANSIRVLKIDSTGSAVANYTTFTAGTLAGCCVGGDQSDTIWIGLADLSPKTYLGGLNPSTMALSSTFTASAENYAAAIKMGIVRTDPATARFVGTFWNPTNATTEAASALMVSVSVSSPFGASVFGTPVFVGDCAAITKPFIVGSRVFCGVSFLTENYTGIPVVDPSRRSLVVVDVTGPTNASQFDVRGMSATRLAWSGLYATNGGVATGVNGSRALTVSTNADGEPTWGLPVVRSAQSIEYDRVTWRTTPRDINSPAQNSETTYLSGAALFETDGTTTCENNFVWGPIVKGTVTVTAGQPNGTYQYKVIYRWTDDSGNVHRSTTSLASANVVTGGAFKIQVVFTGLRVSAKNVFDIYADVYRTKALSGGNTQFYYVGSVLGAAGISGFLDNVADTSLTELIYTAGGVLDNQAPPGLRYVRQFRSRFAGVGDDGMTVYLSQLRNPGDGLAFSDVLTIQLLDGGAITGLEVLDGKLIIFKRDRIYFIEGEGPSFSGQNNDWALPTRIPTDVGCIDANSILLVPAGVVFQSQRGLMLLGRGLDVSFIGGPVDATVGAYPVIRATSIFTTNGDNFAFFVCENSGGTDGRVILWDYRYSIWSVWSPYSGAGYWVKGIASFSDGTIRVNLSSTSLISAMDTTTCLDSGSWVTFDVETAWFKPGAVKGLQNFVQCKRIYALGTSLSAHGLRIRVGVNYASTYSDDRTWAEGVTGVTVVGPVEQAGVHLKKQKGSAFRVRISDTAPIVLGTGQGPAFEGLAFLVGLKQGGPKLPAVQDR